MRVAILAALTASLLVTVGCTVPTWAVIRRFEGDRFRACRIDVGWWAQELVDECGEPTWIRRRVAPDERGEEICAGYSSAAIAGAPGEIAASQVVVARHAARSLRVRDVYLVSKGPPTTISTRAR